MHCHSTYWIIAVPFSFIQFHLIIVYTKPSFPLDCPFPPSMTQLTHGYKYFYQLKNIIFVVKIDSFCLFVVLGLIVVGAPSLPSHHTTCWHYCVKKINFIIHFSHLFNSKLFYTKSFSVNHTFFFCWILSDRAFLVNATECENNGER